MSRTRIVQIIVACLVVGAVHVVLVHWYREVVMNDGIAERTLRQFREIETPVNTLALGDSHVKWGIQPKILAGSFNFAMPGERYVETFYRLRSLLEQGLPVQTVVLGADPHVLAERPNRPIALAQYYSWFVDYPAQGWRRGELLPYVTRWLTGRYAPYAGKRANVLRFLATGEVPELPWFAWVSMDRGAMRSAGTLTDRTKSARTELALDRLRVHFPTHRTDAEAEDHLRRILELCRERGIRVVLVKFPLSDTYRNALMGYLDLPEFDRSVAKAVVDYENARILDLRDRFRGRAGLFADVDHVNARGADIISRIVKDELDQRRY